MSYYMSGNIVVNSEGHEQKNSKVKDEGATIGILDNANALSLWTIAGPELSRSSRFVDFNDEVCPTSQQTLTHKHHAESKALQVKFEMDVK